MANSSDKLSSANRSLLVGAMLGGGASVAKQWKSYQSDQVSTNELCTQAVKGAIKTGLLAGGTTYIAEKMAGRPVLSLATLLTAGTASLYLMEQIKDKQKNE